MLNVDPPMLFIHHDEIINFLKKHRIKRISHQND